MNQIETCNAIKHECDQFLDLLATAGLDTPVPSCPDWTVAELAHHLGGVHRWAQLLVETHAQSPQRRPPLEVDISDRQALSAWFAEGSSALLATLEAAQPEAPMWAWGKDQRVAFWIRRQLHETMMHRVDLELAVGAVVDIDPLVASDNIDELLELLPYAVQFQPNAANLRGVGSLHLHATDPGLEANGEWLIRYTEDGFEWAHQHGKGDVVLRGPLTELALVLNRRHELPGRTEVLGDAAVLEHWLANSAL